MSEDRTFRVFDPEKGSYVEVDPEELSLGPIRHDGLPDDLVERIRALWDPWLKETGLAPSLEQFELAFMRDEDPEAEVGLWEDMVHVARVLSEGSPDPVACRRGVVERLLLYTLGGLTEDEASEEATKRAIGAFMAAREARRGF